MIPRARAKYVTQTRDELYLVIRDVGPWDSAPTVTNDAEAVVQELLASGSLQWPQRLLYYDSGGELSELVYATNGFVGFSPVPKGFLP